jgi:hypothetical protein
MIGSTRHLSDQNKVVGAPSATGPPIQQHHLETNIGEGLNTFLFVGREQLKAMRLDHLNLQTQEVTIP